jgi:carboxyl-terminal processing protease
VTCKAVVRAFAAAALAFAFCVSVRTQDWRATAIASFDDVWKTINESFYDKTFGGLDWAAVASELRPRVQAAATPDEARAVIRDMLARLKRSHFVLLSASVQEALPGEAAVPAEVRITPEGALIVRVTDLAASRAGLSAGQFLVRVDGRDVAPLLAAAEGPDERSKGLDAWRRVTRILHGADGSKASLQLRDSSGRSLDLQISRTLGDGDVVMLGNLPPLRVEFESRALSLPSGQHAGLIRFNYWMTSIGERFERAIDQFRQDAGLIIDLRGNPGGLAFMVGGISGHLIAEQKLLGTMRTRDSTLNFQVNPRLVTTDARQVTPFAGPVAILVDELTGSTSEVFAGSLQSLGRARIFGRATMGQALPALTRQLPNGDVLMYAIGDFVTATGKSLEGAGVIPDVTVLLSAQSLSAGRDDVLDSAVRWIEATGRSR